MILVSQGHNLTAAHFLQRLQVLVIGAGYIVHGCDRLRTAEAQQVFKKLVSGENWVKAGLKFWWSALRDLFMLNHANPRKKKSWTFGSEITELKYNVGL